MSERAFWTVCTLLFAGSVATTMVWCTAMSGMGGMPMPGNWTMSMAWMPMAGQTWPDVAASFLGMWIVMMVAMMLPSLVPILRRYRQAVGSAGRSQLDQLTVWIGTGYFFVWTVFGMAVFALGAGFAALAMQQPIVARAVPVATGVVMVIAGALQFTPWKAHQLACCRKLSVHGLSLPTRAGKAWRYGLHRGLHCSYCCAGLTAVLIVNGVMDLGVMAAITAAVTIERLALASTQVARVIGGIVIAVGIGLMVRTTIGLG
jgi:predicted metal-binding membrane protein